MGCRINSFIVGSVFATGRNNTALEEEVMTKAEYDKKWYAKNRKRILLHNKLYRHTHQEQVKKYSKEYYLNNKEKVDEQHRQYYLKNKKKIIQDTKRRMNKYCKDPSFKLTKNIRVRIWRALKGICKSKATLDLLGCSIEHLRVHLEKQFKPGMSWSNYGKWHIDHIKPCCSFDLTKAKEQSKCFNYKNLQPLWACDNLRKGGTI